MDRYEELLKNIDEQTLDSFKNLLGPKARFDVYDEKVNATRDSATVFVQEIKKDSYDTYLIIYLAKENREWKVLNEDPFFL